MFKVTWNNLIPSKVLLFICRLLNDRLPTIANLFHGGVQNIISPLIVTGFNMNESSKHLFF